MIFYKKLSFTNRDKVKEEPLVKDWLQGDRSLHPAEQFILRLLHHLIAVQCFNSQQVELSTFLSFAYLFNFSWQSCQPRRPPTIGKLSGRPSTPAWPWSTTVATPTPSGSTWTRRAWWSAAGTSRQARRSPPPTTEFSFSAPPWQRENTAFWSITCSNASVLHVSRNGRRRKIWRTSWSGCPTLNRSPVQFAFLGLTDLQERAYVVHHGDKGKICDEINSARWNDPAALLISLISILLKVDGIVWTEIERICGRSIC